MNAHDVVHQPLFGITITVVAYAASLLFYQKWKWIHPLFITSGALILFLLIFNIPYEDYRAGGDLIVFFLGPATVALGVPLYKQSQKIKRNLAAIVTGVTVGSASGLASAAFFVWLLHGSREIMLTMMPKSVTAPIAIEIVRQLGGLPELGAVLTVLTGLFGSMFGPRFLRIIGIRQDIPMTTVNCFVYFITL